MGVKTRFLIISDTQAGSFSANRDLKPDVLIHCGGLTDGSKIAEYRRILRLLPGVDAPLTLVIAGNHDFTLDTPTFRRMVQETPEPLDPHLVIKEYGRYGQAKALFDKTDRINLLNEGTYSFNLSNGASMTVYANPYTPSRNGSAFQCHLGSRHDFAIREDVDVVITHGPPRGILDKVNSHQAGSSRLLGAVARARPRLHCFGHIVAWKEQTTDNPTEFSSIGHSRSVDIDKLPSIAESKSDTPERKAEKLRSAKLFSRQEYCATSHYITKGTHTLFVNASVEGVSEILPSHPYWVVDIYLPAPPLLPLTFVGPRTSET